MAEFLGAVTRLRSGPYFLLFVIKDQLRVFSSPHTACFMKNPAHSRSDGEQAALAVFAPEIIAVPTSANLFILNITFPVHRQSPVAYIFGHTVGETQFHFVNNLVDLIW